MILYATLEEDAVPAPGSDAECPETAMKVLEFAKPHILLIDKWNGSGQDVVVPSRLKKTLIRPLQDGPEVSQTGGVPGCIGRWILLGLRLRAREVRLRQGRSTHGNLGLRSSRRPEMPFNPL